MACRGVHFALTEEQRRQLLEAADDDARRAVLEDVEEAWDRDNLVETDKDWDALHRALAREAPDSQEMPPGSSDDPLSLVILGGKPILEDERSYIIRLIEPSQIGPIVAALRTIDKSQLERCMRRIASAWSRSMTWIPWRHIGPLSSACASSSSKLPIAVAPSSSRSTNDVAKAFHHGGHEEHGGTRSFSFLPKAFSFSVCLRVLRALRGEELRS
jgi:hypothetical protein